jgi:formylglycine-generating enzyme required for sulfatase activity
LTLALTRPASDAPVPVAPAHRGYVETIPGSKVKFAMVAIPGGTFWMGSPEGEKGRSSDEGPRHQVRIAPFWMGKCEVTWDEYDLFHRGRWVSQVDNEKALAANADAVTRPTPPYLDETHGFGREGYPAVGMSHHAAMEYCYWLSKVTGKRYRLPTEAEWEYACRAGASTPYHFGDDVSRLASYAWFEKNADDSTHPVGKKWPNRWGLCDMHGNVAEWCLDHYEKHIYRSRARLGLTLSPVIRPTQRRYAHVVRGGSYIDPARGLRSAARRASHPAWNRIDPDRPQSVWWVWNADCVGFRVVRAVEEQRELIGLRSKVTRKSE